VVKAPGERQQPAIAEALRSRADKLAGDGRSKRSRLRLVDPGADAEAA
jgi:hypothetical protein